MNTMIKTSLATAAVLFSAQAAAQITFYENQGFQGRSFTTQKQVRDFDRAGFNNRASSVMVSRDLWEVCDAAAFRGRCLVLRPGRYPNLAAMGLNDQVSSVREVKKGSRIEESRYAPAPPPAAAEIVFYENDNFQGRSFTTQRAVMDFSRFGFNDRSSSVVVISDRWEVCEDARFSGRCIVLRPGRYPSLASMGLNNRVSSVREVNLSARVEDNRYAPPPAPVYDSRRRRDERLYEANVTSVRAVVGTPEQRCWMESEQVPQQPRSGVNVGGAVVGALIGGVLGHQIGSGRGNDVATVGGAVAGGVVGANVGRGGAPASTREVQRCANVANQGPPDHWDVVYNFRGQDHSIQTTGRPGPTITVNERGEPRT